MNIKQTLSEITNPRFTTEEMETSRTYCGCAFEITSLIFDDNKPHTPTIAIGYVFTPEKKRINANWNKNGECRVDGIRMKAYDLVSAAQQEIAAARNVSVSMLLGLIVIIICAIF